MSKKGGYILIVIIVLILVISLLIGLSATLYFTQSLRRVSVDIHSAQALYLAEAGIREVIYLLSKGQTPPNPTSKKFPFENEKYAGYYEVRYTLNSPSQGLITIEGEGGSPLEPASQTAKRKIRVIVDPDSNYKIISWVEVDSEYVK